jgi:methylmalonyl-CoA/ethylmalonyl-CoA epimerase
MKIEHIGVAVSSLEEAVAAWTGNLGLEVSGYEDVPEEGVRVAMLPLGESRIELLESTRPDSPVGRFLARRGPGVHHLAIRVGNIDAALAKLRAAGARVLEPAPREGAGGTRVAFLHPASMNGVLLELVEHEE